MIWTKADDKRRRVLLRKFMAPGMTEAEKEEFRQLDRKFWEIQEKGVDK